MKDILIYIPQVTIPKEEYEYLKAIQEMYTQEPAEQKIDLELQLLLKKIRMEAQGRYDLPHGWWNR